MTNTIRFTSNTTAVVSKSFMKKAMVYGTDEYRLLKQFSQENPNVKVEIRTIKKKDNKKSYKNMTYSNIRIYIEQQSNSESLLREYERQIKLSKVHPSPYHYVRDWFIKEFNDTENYNEFFMANESEIARKEMVA